MNFSNLKSVNISHSKITRDYKTTSAMTNDLGIYCKMILQYIYKF